MKSKFLVTVVGPTAIGKTSLSLKLAQKYNAPIISCDSRQFYKETRIGTAVPTEEEQAQATHYFIQNRSIFEDYNVGQFEKDALEKLDELFLQFDVVIMVGGSGLYVDAVVNGLDYFPKIDASIRVQLNSDLEEKGLPYLQRKLQELDSETFDTIAIDNPHRVIRALEVCIGSGKTYASFKNKPKTPRKFKTIKVGIKADREIIYNRINQRVDQMIEEGLLDEAKTVYPHKSLNALQTVGYRELFEYFDGNCTLEFAISEIKKNTRRFAKRQITWFKKDPNTIWFDYQMNKEQLFEAIEKQLK
ncbi:tRNA (adenosine(37)-N6)-dimethylallyltransferase MiaA [Flavicella marina]|uniref:tRNA (adenosine(37)-N6)-dimethylallyltransferase MiaA n=1 Tax=Flavicella marina TaxID=1475951 RepID=UPI0012640022|nr:tRNA (adenosine(37)-N6)-dimethylallyltransferase MiaA [Flavicella marina]